MRAQEFMVEGKDPGAYVYHASYLPNLTTGLKSVLTRGLQPSTEGYSGPGLYFAYDPDGGYYHVSKEEATLFRVKWAALVAKFGVYPDNPNGIQRDEDEIIVPGAVPASMLEVEYFPGEWWDVESAYRADLGPVDESDEPVRLKLSNNQAAKDWIQKVYTLYPYTMQNNHVMSWGEGDAQQFAMFELTPSFSKRGAVEVKWIQAYPLRQGVGSRAMQELQRLAKEDGISLTLFPWDKGQVSQSKLTKFYKGQGFTPTVKGGKGMSWSPSIDESLRVDVPNEEWLQSAIDYAKEKSPDRNGLPYMGKTTATVRNIVVPVSILKELPGMRREQQNVRQADLEAIIKIMKSTGKLPLSQHNGEEYKPFINVAYDGSAWVNEGNHRIMAAAALGFPSLPVEISYFDGGERIKSGPMYPGKIGL